VSHELEEVTRKKQKHVPNGTASQTLFQKELDCVLDGPIGQVMIDAGLWHGEYIYESESPDADWDYYTSDAWFVANAIEWRLKRRPGDNLQALVDGWKRHSVINAYPHDPQQYFGNSAGFDAGELPIDYYAQEQKIMVSTPRTQSIRHSEQDVAPEAGVTLFLNAVAATVYALTGVRLVRADLNSGVMTFTLPPGAHMAQAVSDEVRSIVTDLYPQMEMLHWQTQSAKCKGVTASHELLSSYCVN
jgi:hypothetical protein